MVSFVCMRYVALEFDSLRNYANQTMLQTFKVDVGQHLHGVIPNLVGWSKMSNSYSAN